MSVFDLPLQLMRLSKRYLDFSNQIAVDFEWHRRQGGLGLGPLSARLIEQTRLLKSSAICAEDYYHLGLYRGELSFEQKRSFLGSYQKWRYFDRINPPVYDVLARDKALFHIFADSHGIPTPETLATTAPGTKPYFGLRLDTAGAVRQFLQDHHGEDLFFKPADGSLGEGALAVGPDGSSTRAWIELPSQTATDVEGILQHLTPGGKLGRFLVQRRLRPHQLFADIVPHVCPTVRIMTLCTERGVEFLGAAVRIGSGRSATDNVAGGGLIAPITMRTGLLQRAYCLDDGIPKPTDVHPLTGASLPRVETPEWGKIQTLVAESAQRFNFLPCIGWDIGITDGGPVVIEINTRPRCVSVQTAAPHGLLQGPLGRELAKTAGRLGNGLSIDPRHAQSDPQPA
ncbi:sugar-transfer associated ATP-grasp domain-containing protein [Aromatoleum buckelii]|uniref:Alpha-L-glutamate ligase-related protein ATP-grasp domain-containing protein n=1 Tax=Aromatoleum buckelii TaxID=200254 RepID=A0ABX1N3F8_9RHOO|nr:sugar-transfer associated ATP-grasp domain-containing protein [Aromatoleum buckelii]MCK0510758.1 hypothetical protein [Aromatoleum buckelii]